MTVTALNELKAYFERNVLDGVLLQKPNDNNILDYTLVQPAVHMGWIPPNGVLSPENVVTIPCLVVGLDEKESSSDDTTLNLRITVAIYDAGLHKQSGEAMEYASNFEGYITLLNLMDKLEAQVLKDRVFAGKYELASPIKSKLYDEQPYPYWYGQLKFTVTREAYPVTRYEDYL
ncbi:hypothetical protein EDD70_2971 [Hydrogenoanaerobacterium saccharovorans]|uniref:Uncharacterized protein n=1 Tax=Hydrogenoanaerobacterium saccharovorans TaxID=474960 RepID=A0A1H7YHG2_9FIRM|nr:hypothetical protein [Hydrogenoanaerobacterium saccharovorans]RPF41911.1 hypothetical protein EDD70_2971 [Hydrogenoanaerobacterium saccharovorans]SEM45662.1 hypothetical protein SAMN05216180_0054 [Hydrogenoanaerobacterium saccharovorans]